MIFEDKRILITGGTGSLGQIVLKAILSGAQGTPSRIRIFSRDESKQWAMEKETKGYQTLVEYKIGDVRNYPSIAAALHGMDIVINAAALKHVPACENDPLEAVKTNILGPSNIVRAIKEQNLPVETVLGISTDKACSPVSVMGMTKAVQERLFIQANVGSKTKFICIRYGNMLESRGSVVPLFREQIAAGGPVTVTHPAMTRFLVPLLDAARHLIQAMVHCNAGEIYIPKMRSAFIFKLAQAMIGDRDIKVVYTGIRAGEKLDDIIISETESPWVATLDDHFIMVPSLPYFGFSQSDEQTWSYRSAQGLNIMDDSELKILLGV
jgi:FlaA1/EpsC-like NDP-sugar epimerase